MTLKVTSNSIEILNSQGQKKFSSTEPLVFISGYESGTSTCGYYDGSFKNESEFYLTQPLLWNEIGALYITITTITGFGTPGSSFLNVRQPANSVIPIYVRGFPNGNTPAADTTHLSIAPITGVSYNAPSNGTTYKYDSSAYHGEGLRSYGITGYRNTLIYYPYNAGNTPRLFVSGNQGVTNPIITYTWELYKYRYLEF